MDWQLKHNVMDLNDSCYPVVSSELEINHEQSTSLFRKWKQDQQGMTWKEFVNSCQPTFGCDSAITVKWCNMWLCIESDGYCHS